MPIANRGLAHHVTHRATARFHLEGHDLGRGPIHGEHSIVCFRHDAKEPGISRNILDLNCDAVTRMKLEVYESRNRADDR